MQDGTTQATKNLQTKEGIVFDVESLMNYLHQIKDPRRARGVRYSLPTLLTLMILAKLGGEDGMKGISEWVRLRGEELVEMLNLPRTSLPHQTTYERVLAEIDEDEMERVLSAFFHQAEEENITIHIDGKVLRGTIPAGKTQGVHLLAAYSAQTGAVLMQIEVDSKENELVATPNLLKTLKLDGCVVTGDAMFTHSDVCIQIVKAGGDYLFPVKANQKHLQHDIQNAFTPLWLPSNPNPQELNFAYAHSISKGHGRIEHRYLTTTSDLNDYLEFPHVGQVFRLQRVTHQQATGQLTYQVTYGITSLSPEQCSPDQLLELVRSHWHIENRLHYVRDVTFREDDSRIRHTKRQRILATFNNLVIGLIRRYSQFDYIPEARRFFSVKYHQAFQFLLS